MSSSLAGKWCNTCHCSKLDSRQSMTLCRVESNHPFNLCFWISSQSIFSIGHWHEVAKIEIGANLGNATYEWIIYLIVQIHIIVWYYYISVSSCIYYCRNNQWNVSCNAWFYNDYDSKVHSNELSVGYFLF